MKPKACYVYKPCQPCRYVGGCSGLSDNNVPIREIKEEGPTLDRLVSELPNKKEFTQWMSNNYPDFWAWSMVPPKEFEEQFIGAYKQELGYD